jgi:MFS family permease
VFALPSSPRLRRILLAYTVNQLGTWFGYFALSLGIYDHTHSALAVAAMFVAARGLPALLAPALVASTERPEGRGGLSRLYLVEALAAVALAALLWHFWLPGLLVLVAIDGTAALAASALLRAGGAHVAAEEIEGAAPEAVEVAQRRVNAAFNFAFTGTLAFVPVIAGLFVETAGAPTALLIDASTFVLCAALLGRVRPHAEEADGTSVRARLLAALRYLNELPALRSLLLTEAVAVVFFASVEPVEVLYAKQTLAVGDRGFGILIDAWGVGMVVGSLVFARALRRPLGPMLVLGTLLVGLAYLGFAAAPSLPFACAAAIVGGAGNGVQWPSLISAVQQLTPKSLHGRLMSAVESIGALCPAIGFALGGTLAALFSPRTAILVAGLAATAITALFLRISSLSFRLEPSVGAEAAAAPGAAAVPLEAVEAPGGPTA